MAAEMLKRDDLSVYIVAGVPRSFKKKLQKFVEKESKSTGGLMLLDDEMTEWTVARLRGDKRRNHEQTPTSAALWRAFRALSAARYHLQDGEMESKVRALRGEIETLWRKTSPMFDTNGDEFVDEEEEEEEAAAV